MEQLTAETEQNSEPQIAPAIQELPPHFISETLFTAAEIQQRVQELAAAIDRDFPDPDQPVLLVGVLKGATLFLADIVRSISRPIEFDFVAISSYGAATRTSGEVRVLKD